MEKYTMEEFEDMFVKAQAETIRELEADFKRANEEASKNLNVEKDDMFVMSNLLLTLTATACLHKNLFHKEKEPNK